MTQKDTGLQDRTKKFAIEILKLVDDLPSGMIPNTLGRQLLRSGTSVGANCRASFRARSDREYVAKLGIVIEEADETIYWLELLKKIYSHPKLEALEKEAESLLSIFISISKKNKS